MKSILDLLKWELSHWFDFVSFREIKSNPQLIRAVEELDALFKKHGIKLSA